MNLDLANNYPDADAWSRFMRDTFLAPYFYRRYSTEGRYVHIDKSMCSTLLQRELAVDTIVQKGSMSLCIEEKIVQWPGYTYRNFALETDSCTVKGRERKGWMHYAQADYLLYAFAHKNDDALDIYFIDFPRLREWFWSLPVRYPDHVMDTLNRSRIELVPIVDVRKAVPATSRYLVTRTGITFIPNRRAA